MSNDLLSTQPTWIFAKTPTYVRSVLRRSERLEYKPPEGLSCLHKLIHVENSLGVLFYTYCINQ